MQIAWFCLFLPRKRRRLNWLVLDFSIIKAKQNSPQSGQPIGPIQNQKGKQWNAVICNNFKTLYVKVCTIKYINYIK